MPRFLHKIKLPFLIKSFVFIFLIFFSLFLLGYKPAGKIISSNEKTLRVGVYDNYPKVFKEEDGSIQGVLPEIINYIAEKEDWNIDYIYGSWDQGLERLERGEIDIMVDVAISNDRVKKYDFTQETVLYSWGVISVRNNLEIESIKDLDGKKIAVLKSGIYYGGTEGIDTYIHSFGFDAVFVDVKEYSEVYDLVEEGKVDAAVVSRIFAMSNRMNYPNIKQTGIYFNPTEIRFALTKEKSGNDELISKIDYWVNESKRTGVYDEIFDKYGLTSGTISKNVTPWWVFPSIITGGIVLIILILILIKLINNWLISIKKLNESEKRFRSTLDNMINGAQIIDKNFRYLYLNNSAVEQSRKSKNNLIGKTMMDVYPGIEETEMFSQLKNCMENKKQHNMINEFIYPDGKKGYFRLNIVPVPEGLFIISEDITQIRRTEDELQILKERGEAILDSIGDAVFATDREGEIVLFNKMAEKISGFSSDEAIGKNYKKILRFIREKDGKPIFDFVKKVVVSKEIFTFSEHLELIKKDGSKIPVSDSAAPFKNHMGVIIGCVVVFHDTTKERQIDKAKTEFVTLTSHQLRTPLSTINWYSEMLLYKDPEKEKLSHKQKNYIREVYKASQRMVRLVNSLLNVSRLELGNFISEPVDVNLIKLAKMNLNYFEPKIRRKKLKVIENYDPAIKIFKADPKLLNIILQNFLANSVKYTNNKGKIELSILKDKNSLLIKVSDDGIGIPKSQQGQIFQKMFRAENAKMLDPDGTGLGLYIAKEIIKYTGGDIWFDSVEGKGSAFYARFPKHGMSKKLGTKELII